MSDCAEALYDLLPRTRVCHLTLNIHGKLANDFLHCTARHVDKQKPLCPITINTWGQLTNEGKALFKELELDKNSAVTLNVCEVHVPSDESGDNKIVSIDNPASLIALLEGEEKTGKEDLRVGINVQSDNSTCGESDDSISRSWNDSLLLGLAGNCSLKSLTLTINNFSPRSIESSLTLIGCLEGCSSLKSLTLTLNEYNEWKRSYPYLLCKGLGRNTSLVSLSLTLNIYTRVREWMKANSLKTLRLKIKDLQYRIGCREYHFSDWVEKIPSLELQELTIIRYGVVGSWVETLKWEKQRSLRNCRYTLSLIK